MESDKINLEIIHSRTTFVQHINTTTTMKNVLSLLGFIICTALLLIWVIILATSCTRYPYGRSYARSQNPCHYKMSY
jgi:hypothetical protein